MTKGALDLILEVAQILDDLEIRYALGGSMASSLFGEPRSTLDVDIAIKPEGSAGEALLVRAGAVFYVPVDAARAALANHTSFNLVDSAHGLKVDLFVLGEGLLDRMQIERRVQISIPGSEKPVCVTSPEDQVLRKLDWFRTTGRTSERQWRDVIGILQNHGDKLDDEYLHHTAQQVELTALLDQAIAAARREQA
jgi:hypothetical protein